MNGRGLWITFGVACGFLVLWLRCSRPANEPNPTPVVGQQDPSTIESGPTRAKFQEDLQAAIQASSIPPEKLAPSRVPDGDLAAHIKKTDPDWFKLKRTNHGVVSRIASITSRVRPEFCYRDKILNPRDRYIPPARRVQLKNLILRHEKIIAPIDRLLSKLMAERSVKLASKGDSVKPVELEGVKLTDEEISHANYRAQKLLEYRLRSRKQAEARGGRFPSSPPTYEDVLAECIRRAQYKKLHKTDVVLSVGRSTLIAPDKIKAKMRTELESAVYLRTQYFLELLQFYVQAGVLASEEPEALERSFDALIKKSLSAR